MNRHVISGGPPSGSVREGFEGAERPWWVSIAVPSTRPAAATTAAAAPAVQVCVRTPRFPLVFPPGVDQGALLQDCLQLVQGLPGDGHLNTGRPALGRRFQSGAVLARGGFLLRFVIISSFWGHGGFVRKRADRNHSRGVRGWRGWRGAGVGVDDGRAASFPV